MMILGQKRAWLKDYDEPEKDTYQKHSAEAEAEQESDAETEQELGQKQDAEPLTEEVKEPDDQPAHDADVVQPVVEVPISEKS